MEHWLEMVLKICRRNIPYFHEVIRFLNFFCFYIFINYFDSEFWHFYLKVAKHMVDPIEPLLFSNVYPLRPYYCFCFYPRKSLK